MSSAKSRILKSEISAYFKANAKIVVSALVILVVGVIAGVALVYREVGGEFETVTRVDAETGAGKIFFLALAALVASYALVLLSGLNKKTVFLCCIPYFFIGFILGRCSTALICRYEIFGLLNFLFIYLPVFLISIFLLVIATARVLSASCTECGVGKLKPSFVALMKIFAINAAVCFVFIVLVGLLVGGVIIPTPFDA